MSSIHSLVIVVRGIRGAGYMYVEVICGVGDTRVDPNNKALRICWRDPTLAIGRSTMFLRLSIIANHSKKGAMIY